MEKVETGVWAKKSKNGTKYYFGYDKETNTKVVIFNNTKDWEKQPDMNVIVEDWDDKQKKRSKNKSKKESEQNDNLPF